MSECSSVWLNPNSVPVSMEIFCWGLREIKVCAFLLTLSKQSQLNHLNDFSSRFTQMKFHGVFCYSKLLIIRFKLVLLYEFFAVCQLCHISRVLQTCNDWMSSLGTKGGDLCVKGNPHGIWHSNYLAFDVAQSCTLRRLAMAQWYICKST